MGKSNLGRSASPRKRVGGALVERLPAERWWIPAGPVHPNCRGFWAVVDKPSEWVAKLPPEERKEIDDFDKVLDAIAEKHRKTWKGEK